MSFDIAGGQAEISFTFNYDLNGPIKYQEGFEPKPGPVVGLPMVDRRDWINSELAAYVSDQFMKELILDHFHIQVVGGRITVPIGPPTVGDTAIFFLPEIFPHAAASGPPNGVAARGPLHSVAAIECDLFKTGFLSVVLRLKNENQLGIEDYLDVTRHPELAEYTGAGHTGAALYSGELVDMVCNFVTQTIEPILASLLNSQKIEYLEGESGQWIKLPSCSAFGGTQVIDAESIQLYSRDVRQPPYVGLLFNFSSHPTRQYNSAIGAHQKILRQFIVAAGRATPSYLTMFKNARKYLATNGRDLYGSGDTIVFVGRRAWCAYDSTPAPPSDPFRLGVIETTHFVIRVLQTAASSRRRFVRDVNQMGAPIFQELNRNLHLMVGSRFPIGKYRAFRHAVAKATSFMARARIASPCEDLTNLLEAHVRSHTASAAARRCKDIMDFNDLSEQAREKMANYNAFLGTSSSYLSVRSWEVGLLALAASVLTILGAIAVSQWEWLISLL